MLVCATGSPAQDIYRWVDAEGVIHFSDTPPATEVGEVETIAVDVGPPAAGAAGEVRFNIAATAERMQAIREELDEDLDARRDRQRAAPPPVVQYPETTGYGLAWPYGYPGYPGYPARPRPPRPPRPDPPHGPPPADDTATWRPPGRADG
jgi:hypothetical protein